MRPHGPSPGLLATVLLVVLGLGLRIAWILRGNCLTGDEAVFGLMAKHIAELKEFPIYVWGANYSGTLSIYLAALLFKCFGISAPAFQAVGVFYFCLFVACNFLLARYILGDGFAFPALALALFPPVNIFALSMLAQQYGEALVLGSLLIWFSVLLMDSEFTPNRAYFYWGGFVSGLGMWLTPHIVPFALTFFGALWIKNRKIFLTREFAWCFVFFLVGYGPAVIYNWQHPMAQAYRMGGRILDLNRDVLTNPHLKSIVAWKILLRFATAPMTALKLPKMMLSFYGAVPALLFGTAVVWAWRRSGGAFWRRRDGTEAPLLQFIVWSVIYYSIVAVNTPPRYTLPLYVVFPVLFSGLLVEVGKKSMKPAAALLGFLFLLDAYGVGYALLHHPECRYRRLTEWLEANGIARGYSDYWTAYPVIFESKERVLISPTLIHPTLEDRRPEYTAAVRASKEASFIVDSAERPCAAAAMTYQLSALGFHRSMVDSFTVFYGSSRNIDPQSLKLSEQCPAETAAAGA